MKVVEAAVAPSVTLCSCITVHKQKDGSILLAQLEETVGRMFTCLLKTKPWPPSSLALCVLVTVQAGGEGHSHPANLSIFQLHMHVRGLASSEFMILQHITHHI